MIVRDVDLDELLASMARHPGIRGRGTGRRGRPSVAELAANERCECGAYADDRHPPIRVLPLDYGRPCSRPLEGRTLQSAALAGGG